MYAFIASGFCLFAIIATFLGLFTNSWVIREIEEEDGSISEIYRGLRESEGWVMGTKVNIDHSDLADITDDERTEKLNVAGLVAYIILWIALPLCIGSLVLSILSGIGIINGTSGFITSLIGGFLIILAVILFVTILPSLRSTDHFGWTFYIVIIGGFIQIIGGILDFGIEKKQPSKTNPISPLS